MGEVPGVTACGANKEECMLLGMSTCEELDFALEREREGQGRDLAEQVGYGARLGMMGVHLEDGGMAL